MPTTSNFGWTTPADTDLVKDGAAAIRTLGNGVDTSLVDLKGGTTGQILSKTSNTDLDYTWITPNVGDITEVQAGTGISIADGTGPIPVVTNTVATEFDAKGDLIVGTGSDTFDRLAVGTNGYTLVADSAETTGLKWAAPAASGGETLISTTALTSGSSVALNSIPSTYKHLRLEIVSAYASGEYGIDLTFNSDTGTNYDRFYCQDSGSFNADCVYDETKFTMGTIQGSSTSSYMTSGICEIYNYANTEFKPIKSHTFNRYASGGSDRAIFLHARYRGSSAISSISVSIGAGTFTAGTLYFYGIS